MLAVVDLDLAVGASEAIGAGTGIAALASVGTGSTILAWTVVRAVVEICNKIASQWEIEACKR